MARNKNEQVEPAQRNTTNLQNEVPPFGGLWGTFKDSWTPRTGLHTVAAESARRGSHEEWVRTRDVILKVVRRFPTVIQEVRDALEAYSRTCPKELLDPA